MNSNKNNDGGTVIKKVISGKSLALLFAVIILTNLLTAGTVYLIMRLTYYPTPVTRTDITVDYSFDNDHLVALTENLYFNIVSVQSRIGTTPSGDVGTGVIFEYQDGKPVIVTNFHVLAGSGSSGEINLNKDDILNRNISVKFPGSLKFSDAGVTVLGYDVANDIAVIRLDKQVAETALDLYSTRMGDSAQAKYGQRVLALGNALGQGIAASDGIIGKTEDYVQKKLYGETISAPVLQSSAPINSGNSGGGLFNMEGKLIGINTYQAVQFEKDTSVKFIDNISYSVPVSIVKGIYDAILSQESALAANAVNNRQVAELNIRFTSDSANGYILEDRRLGAGLSLYQHADMSGSTEKQSVRVLKATAGFNKDTEITKVGNYSLITVTEKGEYTDISLQKIAFELYKYCTSGTKTALKINDTDFNAYKSVK